MDADRFVMVDVVRAKRRIEDSPLAKDLSPARRGALGQVVDVVPCDGLVFVDFGRGAIACSPGELAIISEEPRVRFSR